jgi:aspartyl-tRNA(Asn)/glutamyl-tRNA(Gln) amidotransferase subunit A
MSNLPRTIVEAGAWLRDGRITCTELTEGLLDRAEAAQESLGAFITIARDSALAAARTVDDDRKLGIDRGPLHGVPIGVKDIIATIDAPTTANSRVLDRAWGAGRDAGVMLRLREAGAIMLGKLVLNEFATGFPDPDTGFPIPKNPWDTSRFPGGSSSGTGVAVAAGLILGGLGTDTGGSIRGPSSFCGITGLKPTFGLVSKAGCVPLGYSLDNIGPMTHTVRDCALMLQVMAGFDPNDECSVDLPVKDMLARLDGSLAGVKIGVPYQHFFDVSELNPEVKSTVLAAIDVMKAAGATVVDVEIPHADLGRHAQRVIMHAEAFAYHEPDLQTRPELYGKYTRQNIRQGAMYTAADFVHANRVRGLVKAEAFAALADVDVLITPTSVNTAPTYAGYSFERQNRQVGFTNLWNLTGFPAMSICCGFSSDGVKLPIGMQIIGKPFDEPTVFKVGDAFQGLTEWHLAIPETLQEAALV